MSVLTTHKHTREYMDVQIDHHVSFDSTGISAEETNTIRHGRIIRLKSRSRRRNKASERHLTTPQGQFRCLTLVQPNSTNLVVLILYVRDINLLYVLPAASLYVLDGENPFTPDRIHDDSFDEIGLRNPTGLYMVSAPL